MILALAMASQDVACCPAGCGCFFRRAGRFRMAGLSAGAAVRAGAFAMASPVRMIELAIDILA
jgi:hypothetical protein